MRKRNWINLALSLIVAALLASAILWVRNRGLNKTSEALKGEAQMNEAGKPATIDLNNKEKRIFFRFNGVDNHYGKLAFAPYEHPDRLQFVDALSCEIAHVSANRGICLAAKRGVVTTYTAKLFDATTFQILAEVPLEGSPSGCRMSSDGKLASLAVFVNRQGIETSNFSTQSLLINIADGRIITDLKQFTVTRDGQIISDKDLNFWCVTFTPDNRYFYATLTSNQQNFLAKGDINKRSAEVIHDNVEGPSLAPNAIRIAYKKRVIVNGRVFLRPHILDLQTKQETQLSEKRSVDDQLEWLDNDHILYSLPESETSSSAGANIWLLATDGASAPKLFIKKANSPSTAPLQ